LNGSHDQVGIQILNNTFKNWGGTEAQEDTAPTKPAALLITGGWDPPVGTYLPNGTVVRGNRFDGNRLTSIKITSTKNTLVENNEITNGTCGRDSDGAVNALGIKIATGTNNMETGTLIRNNQIHDFAPWSACGLTSVPGTWPSMVGIWADVGPINGVIESNQIWNLDQGNPGMSSPAIGIHIEYDCHGWTVKNNVIYNSGSEGMRHNPTTAGAVNSWFNNTVYNIGAYGMRLYSGNAVVKNNIVDNAGVSQIHVDPPAVSQGNITIDYNDYWNSPTGAKVGQWSGAVQNFSGWKIACNCDAHSLNTDPLFVNPPSNFDLQPSSPARGAGERGLDMGAYVLSPPTNLRVIQILP
jgi:Right handed beta helix region